MSSTCCSKPKTRTVKPVAPEDLAPGMFVCAMQVIAQCWPDVSCAPEGSTLRALKLVFTPQEAGMPVKVVSVCLPFVLVETFEGRAHLVDIRLVRLARVRKKHAKAVFAALAKNKTLNAPPTEVGAESC